MLRSRLSAPSGNTSARGRNKAAIADAIEYYHPTLDHYFLTALESEVQALDSGAFPGWLRTGHQFGAPYSEDGSRPTSVVINSATQAAPAQEPLLSPVCRFYGNPASGLDSHFYSASPAECSEVLTRFANDWLLRPQIIYSENNSNVALSEYKRTEITVTLRHDFR